MSELTKTQKKKAVKNYRAYLQQMSKSSQFWQNSITPLDKFQRLENMNKIGIISDSEFERMGDILLWLEVFRLINERYGKAVPKENEYEYDIDTSKLIAGMTVKNYRVLCDLVGDKPASGKRQKDFQEKRWRYYFDFEKNRFSNEIVILEVYDEPMTPEERKYKNAAFINEMKVLILNKLAKQRENDKGNIVCLTSYTRLIKELNLTTPYMYEQPDNILDFLIQKFGNSLSNGKIKWNYTIFRNNTFRKIKNAVESALSGLQKDEILFYRGEYIIVTDTETGKIHQVADDDQTAIIIKIKKQIANDLGYDTSIKATMYNKERYNALLRDAFFKEFGCDYVYYQLKIVVNRENLEKHIDEYTSLDIDHSVFDLSTAELRELYLKYNANLTKALKDKANNQQERAKQKFLESLQETEQFSDWSLDDLASLFKPETQPKIAKYGDDFRKMQSQLTDLFVNKDFNDPDQLKELKKFFDNIHRLQYKVGVDARQQSKKQPDFSENFLSIFCDDDFDFED